MAGQVRFSVVAPATERLDRFLADQLQLSRTQAARLVAAGKVEVDGRRARASRQLARGEVVSVIPPSSIDPETGARTIRPAAIPLSIVYEDDHLAVIDKPAGLVVHPAPGHWDDTLVNALVARGTALAPGAEGGRPGIVHRLDRDTSGLIIVAKTQLAHRRLAAALSARRIYRAYAGLVWGHLKVSPQTIDAPLARHPHDRKRMAVLATGRPAQSVATVVARFGCADLLRIELRSGRTHQIRVHLSHIGHPLVGDPVYGGGGSRRISGAGRHEAETVERATIRQALHAAIIKFRHPATSAPLELTSEWPPDVRAGLDVLGGADLVAQKQPLRYLRFFTHDG